MSNNAYLMENDFESLRMEIKTKKQNIIRQALWAGILPGMRIADIGCGPGKTTSILHEMVQPGGQTVGIDFSEDRICRAKNRYVEDGLTFHCYNIHDDLSDLGKFDLIWVRFVLEYHRTGASGIVRHLANLLNPEGILCLIDLDQNCLNHYEAPPRLCATMQGLMGHLSKNNDFDPQAGRKLYSYLYDMNFKNISIHLEAHHLIFGEINNVDYFNWEKKVLVAGKRSGYDFREYDGGFEEFYAEFDEFFRNPRRFTYTPIICCKGNKPSSS